MRQTTLGHDLRLHRRAKATGADALIRLLTLEEEIAFYSVLPHGNVLKCISELLMRCALHVPVSADEDGLTFVACDSASGRLIHVLLDRRDMLAYRFQRPHTLRCSVDASSMHATFHQLKRKDVVLLYATASGRLGSLVDYSGRLEHTKHSSISSQFVGNSGPSAEYAVPSGYRTAGVVVPSNILQRCLREYKSLTKRIILTGNDRYIHISADARVSLHRADNLFGTPEPREDDVAVELSISTLSRILKVTQFSPHVAVVCEPSQPVLLHTPIGRCGSHVDVYIQTDGSGAP